MMSFNDAEARAMGYTGPPDVYSFLLWRRDHPEQVNQQVAAELDAAVAARNAHEGGTFAGLGPAVRLGASVLMGGAAGAGLGAIGGAAAGGVEAGGAAASGLEAGASPFLSGLDSAAIAGADFSGGTLASLAEGAGGLGSLGASESLLGPATGTIESAPVIGASGVPEISGVAQGAGAFLPPSDLASLLGPATGTVEPAPVIGSSGSPIVSGIAHGAGEFLPTAAGAALGGLGGSSLADLASAAGGSTVPTAATAPAVAAETTPATLADAAAGWTTAAPAAVTTPAAAGSTIPAAAAVPAAAAAGALPGVGDAGAFDQGGSAAYPTGANANGMGEGSIFAPAAGAAGAGTALSRLLDGSATTADLLSLGGTGLATGLGVYGANQQTQAYKDLSEKYMAMGAPYRQKLSDLYANPSSYLQSSEVQTPVQQGTDAMARALSVRGNPTGSGTALQELQNYSANQLYGRLGEEKNRLAGFGGLTQYNAAAPGAAAAGVGAQGGIYNALGYGLGQLTNPQPTLAQSLNQFRGALGSLT